MAAVIRLSIMDIAVQKVHYLRSLDDRHRRQRSRSPFAPEWQSFMARTKTARELTAFRKVLASRLEILRKNHFGEHGSAACAASVGIPYRSWWNYERGIAVPGEVILRVIELTNVEPMWLLHGTMPMYRQPPTTNAAPAAPTDLVREALTMLKTRPKPCT
jgi:hypothetical protein